MTSDEDRTIGRKEIAGIAHALIQKESQDTPKKGKKVMGVGAQDGGVIEASGKPNLESETTQVTQGILKPQQKRLTSRVLHLNHFSLSLFRVWNLTGTVHFFFEITLFFQHKGLFRSAEPGDFSGKEQTSMRSLTEELIIIFQTTLRWV